MFGGAGLVALYGVGALVAAAVLGLATVLEPWIAAAAIDSVQRDIETVKARAKS